MRQSKHILYFILIIFSGSATVFGQNYTAVIVDKQSHAFVADAKIIDIRNKQVYYSDQYGQFTLKIPSVQEDIILEIHHPLYKDFLTKVSIADWLENESFYLESNEYMEIDLSGDQIESSDESSGDQSEVYSQLTSNKNPIINASAFEWRILRFSIRAIPFKYTQLGFNGFLLNDQFNDLASYYILSGQNNLNRFSETNYSYAEQEFDFGSVGTSQWISCFPSALNKGLKVNYSITNTAYSHRLGFHYNGQIFKKGPQFIFGANRRWAQEANFPGSFYDAYGLYLGFTKELNYKSKLNFISVYTPTLRGKSAPIFNETVELTKNPLYNPYWGCQEGKKRNSRMASRSVSSYYLNLTTKYTTNFTGQYGLMFSKGKYSDSNIDWYNTKDPRPDYYQYLPSFEDNPNVKNQITNAWKNDPSVSQLDWNNFYQTNYQNYETTRNINGTKDSIFGRRSLYTLLNNHADPTNIETFARLIFQLSPKIKYNSVLRLENAHTDYYLEMVDLLGGDYFVDYSKFIIGNQNPNLINTNHIVKKGDRFGYNYDAISTKLSWLNQFNLKQRKFDFLFSMQTGLSWLEFNNNYKNAIFDFNNSSLDKFSFFNGFQKDINLGLKGEVTYKLSGRNYFDLKLASQFLNPNFNQIAINPAFREDRLPINNQTKIQLLDLSYSYSAPDLKASVSVYGILIKDQIQARNFYLDPNAESDATSSLLDGGFVNGFYTHLDEQHKGIEASMTYSVNSILDIGLVANESENIYVNRPQYYYYDQYNLSQGQKTIYLKNFFVPNTPQLAINTFIKCSFPKNGSAALNLNYLDKSYIEVDPLRRIPEAVNDLDRTSNLFKSIINQEKLPSVITLNASFFKSIKVKSRFCTISLNVNNILNNRNILSGGFEQSRFDYKGKDLSKFPNKYFHAQGINFFLNFNISLN